MTHVASVAVAIVSWDGREHLETCLEALEGQRSPGIPVRIVVLDNGSCDGTSEWLAQRHPDVDVLRSDKNLGFCGANNLVARHTDADAIAFLNNDTRAEPDWLGRLVTTLRDSPPDVAAVSGHSVSWDATQLDFARGHMLFDGHAYQDGMGMALADAPLPEEGEELQFPHGGNMLVRRDVFLELGGYDEGFFAYFDDVDLGWRLWSAGYRVVASPARVRHRSMGTSRRLGEENRSFLYVRNAFRTVYKNYDDDMWQRLMPAVMITFMARTRTSLAENNPGGGTLTLDPYQGLIANTPAPHAPAATATDAGRLLRHARRWGAGALMFRVGELLRIRGMRRLGYDTAEPPPVMSDVYTVSRFRALSSLIANLDDAAACRMRVQDRRRRTDREIFERFPLRLAAINPGDQELFDSSGFQAWLPTDPRLLRVGVHRESPPD